MPERLEELSEVQEVVFRAELAYVAMMRAFRAAD